MVTLIFSQLTLCLKAPPPPSCHVVYPCAPIDPLVLRNQTLSTQSVSKHLKISAFHGEIDAMWWNFPV